MENFLKPNKKTSLREAPVNLWLSSLKIWNNFQKSLTLIQLIKVKPLMEKDIEDQLEFIPWFKVQRQ